MNVLYEGFCHMIWGKFVSFSVGISDTCSALLSTECVPCNCDTEVSLTSACDSKGHCTCKNKYYGPKCKHRDCEMTTWSDWTNCRCGHTDTKNRTRSVTTQSAGEGFACKHTQETGTCVMIPCHCPTIRPGYYGDRCEHRDCVLKPWSAWSSCACPGGTTLYRLPNITPKKQRSRDKQLSKVGSGAECGPQWEENYCGFTCVSQCRKFLDEIHCSYHSV